MKSRQRMEELEFANNGIDRWAGWFYGMLCTVTSRMLGIVRMAESFGFVKRQNIPRFFATR